MLMPDDIGFRLGEYKHLIIIGVALAALASYFLPLNFVFAAGTGNTGTGNTGNHNSGSGFIGNNCGSGHYQ
jgi:hypothetical protein